MAAELAVQSDRSGPADFNRLAGFLAILGLRLCPQLRQAGERLQTRRQQKKFLTVER